MAQQNFQKFRFCRCFSTWVCDPPRPPTFLVSLFLTNLVRISGFSSLFSAIAVFLALSGKMCWRKLGSLGKERKNPEILTKLVRKRLTRFQNNQMCQGSLQVGFQESVRIGVRQRSGEGVVRRNGCPKGCFWRVRCFSALLRFALKTPENLKGAEKQHTLQKHPFGQPFLRAKPSPLLWLERGEKTPPPRFQPY